MSITFFGQNHRFIYEYTFKMDSLNREHSEKELMNLDISKNGSHYYSHEKMIYDSLNNAEFDKATAVQSNHVDLSKIKNKAKIYYSVSKKYPNLDVTLHNSINGDFYAINSNEKLNWIIMSDTKDIEGIKVQKATTRFSGRKWIAWFANEIQFQDGPYKFCGLPGLILHIEDIKQDHVFKLIGSKKQNNWKIFQKDDNRKELTISPKKFKELWKEYLADPAKKIRQQLSDSETQYKITDASGKVLSTSEIIRNKENQVKERMKKTNNFLELDLYKQKEP